MYQIVDRPGYFGDKRQQRVDFYDNLFGADRWSEMWEVDGSLVSFAKAVSMYDESYYQHLAANPEAAVWASSFGDCSDIADTYRNCCDPHATPRYLQAASVRRALTRLGFSFAGPVDRLLSIRGPESNGHSLNPGHVPFHCPSLILQGTRCGKRPGWAEIGSVEHFWQANKVIVIHNQCCFS